MENVTIEKREQFTEDAYCAFVQQLGDKLEALSADEFMVADRMLRRFIDVLFLESVATPRTLH